MNMGPLTFVEDEIARQQRVIDLSHGPDHVLVVEDDAGDATLITEMLRAHAISAEVAPTLMAAQERLADREFTCILLDLHLPDAEGTSGIEVLLALAADTPVIVVTGLDDEATAIGALRLGVQDYLVKGRAGDDDLIRTIRRSIERKRIEREAAREALHDPLTGVPNRRYLLARLDDAIERGTEKGEVVAVLFLDFDGFKVVNDTFGHQGGDAVLVESARRIADAVRPSDVVARYGGDEFVVLCEDVGAGTAADEIAQRVARACDEPLAVDGSEITLHVSIGVATTEAGPTTSTTLIRMADVAMYRAKEDRRKHRGTRPRRSDPPRMVHVMGSAVLIERRHLAIEYQPLIATDSMRPVAVEALCRLRRGDGRIVPPDAFIPALERSGGIIEVGLWVLEEACETVARSAACDGLSLNVNLSPVQVRPSLLDSMNEILETTGLASDRLTLELTESATAVLREEHLDILAELSWSGVRIALDDFGIGYSSLKRAASLPVQMIKLDKTFIEELPESPEAVAVTRNVLRLGRDLGADVVAEGVERAAQWDVLHGVGYEFVQGNLVKPARRDLEDAIRL